MNINWKSMNWSQRLFTITMTPFVLASVLVCCLLAAVQAIAGFVVVLIEAVGAGCVAFLDELDHARRRLG